MPDDDNLLQFLDDDLRAELEQWGKHGPGAGVMRDIILEKQRKRQARREMTPVQRRRDIARETLKADMLKDADRYHIHSVLAMCGLPYRRPDDGAVEYIQRYGKNSLVVTAGRLQDPESGQMVRPGLPYGPKARLMMLHICTEALRSGSPEIHVGDSMSAFIRELGFPVSGGKNGTISLFKEQINRLAAAHMTIGLWDGEHGLTLNSKPIEEFSIWFPKNPNQRVLWPSRLVLEDKFFKSLKRHALPVDIRVAAYLRQLGPPDRHHPLARLPAEAGQPPLHAHLGDAPRAVRLRHRGGLQVQTILQIRLRGDQRGLPEAARQAGR